MNIECSVEDCSRSKICRGLCKKHYDRWAKYGDPQMVTKIYGDDEARFWSYVDKESDPNGCWIWTGTPSTSGYGKIAINRDYVYAHRWAYEHFVGPIPDGYEIDHVYEWGCRNTLCVNYEQHLEPVTPEENLRRRTAYALCPHLP